MRRRALVVSPLLLAAPSVRMRGVIQQITADRGPCAMAQGPESGFVRTLAAGIFRMVGLQVVLRFPCRPEAAVRPAAGAGTAIAPPARTGEREWHFPWVVARFADPSGFASIQVLLPDMLAAARELPRIGVTGSLHEAYLRERRVTNLVPPPAEGEAMAAIRAREVSTWFRELPRLRAHLARSAQLGRPIFSQTVWLGLDPQTSGMPVAELRDALVALEANGSADQILRPFLGAA